MASGKFNIDVADNKARVLASAFRWQQDEDRVLRALYGMAGRRCGKTMRGANMVHDELFLTEVKSMSEWHFKSIHPADIDFQEIADNLTRQQPLAFVHGKAYYEAALLDDNGNLSIEYSAPKFEGYVVLHPSLFAKSLVTADEIPSGPFYTMPDGSKASAPMRVLGDKTRVYVLDEAKDFARWATWARKVRGGSWDDDQRRRAEFTVTLPNV